MANKQAGTYFGELVGAGADTLNNAKKTPFIYLTFRVTHFFAGNWQEVELFDRDVKYFLSDSAWPYTEKELQRLGFNGDFVNPEFMDELYKPGTELLCSTRASGDKSYEDWELPGRVNGSKERVAPANEVLQKFKARWNTNSSARKPPPANTPVQTPASPPGRAGDDIPF